MIRKRRVVAATAVAVGAVCAGGAVAAVSANKPPTAIKLSSGQAVTFGGITCTAYDGTTATNANIVCVRNNLKGYGVVVSQDMVIVAKKTGAKVVVAFKQANK